MNKEETFEMLRKKRFFPVIEDISWRMLGQMQEVLLVMAADDPIRPVSIYFNSNTGKAPSQHWACMIY